MTSSDSARSAGAQRTRTPIQLAALVVGAVFLLVGILGFIPGITTNFDQLTFAGHHSGAMLLGIFHVSILHNLVHLAFGVAGLALARTFTGARGYLLVSGAIYALLGIYGVVIDQQSGANFVPVNTADNWLHFGLAALMLALGFALGKGGPELTTRRGTGIIE